VRCLKKNTSSCTTRFLMTTPGLAAMRSAWLRSIGLFTSFPRAKNAVVSLSCCDALHPILETDVRWYAVGSCTPNLRLIRQHAIRVAYPSFTTCGRGLCHGLRSLFLPAGADRHGVAMRHAPVGMAQRHRRVPAATGAPTPTAQAPS